MVAARRRIETRRRRLRRDAPAASLQRVTEPYRANVTTLEQIREIESSRPGFPLLADCRRGRARPWRWCPSSTSTRAPSRGSRMRRAAALSV
jgi:hypothetical protein